MERHELSELHFIAPIQNLAGILQHGLLSHVRAQQIPHLSVADPDLVNRRKTKRTPAGRPLLEYVNLYINARNAMLYRRCAEGQHDKLCILRVSLQVLDFPGALVTDRNAAAMARFENAPSGLRLLDHDRVFALSWDHADQIEKSKHRQIIQAEVLIPDLVPPNLLLGAYTSGQTGESAVHAVTGGILPVVRDSQMFFGWS